MTVEQYCQLDVETIERDALVDSAALRMQDAGIGCVVVVDGDNRPVGMLTDRDLTIRVVAEGLEPSKTHVSDVMSTPLIWVEPHMSIDAALERMAQHGVRRAPVVAGGWCNGMIVLDDVLAAIAHELQCLSLGTRGRIRHSRRHAQLEQLAAQIEMGFSEALSWLGKGSRALVDSADKLARGLREAADRGKTPPE